jgi:hypothetical protein
MAHVFLSHRRNDADSAERLAADIKSAGHKVWLDDWEINIGDSIVERMQQGLEGAAYLVLCYSETGVLAPWISREWMSTLARQMSGSGIKILPAKLTGGEPPALLSDLRYADLAVDWNNGLKELLRAIR